MKVEGPEELKGGRGTTEKRRCLKIKGKSKESRMARPGGNLQHLGGKRVITRGQRGRNSEKEKGFRLRKRPCITSIGRCGYAKQEHQKRLLEDSWKGEDSSVIGSRRGLEDLGRGVQKSRGTRGACGFLLSKGGGKSRGTSPDLRV